MLPPSPLQLQPRWGWGGKGGVRRNKPVRRKTTSDTSPGLAACGAQAFTPPPTNASQAPLLSKSQGRQVSSQQPSSPRHHGRPVSGHRLGLRLHSDQSAHSTCSAVFFSKLQSNLAMGMNPPHQPRKDSGRNTLALSSLSYIQEGQLSPRHASATQNEAAASQANPDTSRTHTDSDAP